MACGDERGTGAPGSARCETFRVGFHSAPGLAQGGPGGLFVSVQIITPLFSFFAGSTHFFKGLGTEDFLKAFMNLEHSGRYNKTC